MSFIPFKQLPVLGCRKLICGSNTHRIFLNRFISCVSYGHPRGNVEAWWPNQRDHMGYVKQRHLLSNCHRRLLFRNQLASFSKPQALCCQYTNHRSLRCSDETKLPASRNACVSPYWQCRQYCQNQGNNGETKPQKKVKQEFEELLEKENVLTVPNMLTMSRIIVTPFLGYLVLQESFAMATGVFIIAGFTDLLDGYIARNFKNQTSAFGSFLDPLADKLLVSVLYVTLTLVHLIPVPLAVLVIGRDALLIAGAFYVRYISLPPPRTLSRYFNATKVSAELKPLFISKLNTALQLLLVAASLTAPVFDFVNHPVLQFLWYTTAATTVASGVGYMFAKGTFRELRKKKTL